MTALKELLRDPSKIIAWVVELDTRDPDTDAEVTFRYKTEVGGDQLGFGAYLVDPGGWQAKTEADGRLAAMAQPVVKAVKLRNEPVTAGGGEGKLDHLRRLTMAGREARLYAGAHDEPFANYERRLAAVVDGEPVFDGADVEVRFKGALSRLAVDLDVGNYVGEPGALRLLTNPLASVSDNAAHHLSDFTIARRVRVTNYGGSSVAYNLTRRFDGVSINWVVRVLGGGTAVPGAVEGYFSTGGTIQVLLRSAAGALLLDEWHWILFARRSGHVYLMIDGQVVAESTATAEPDHAFVAGLEVARGSNLQHDGNDHRILNHYITPDEARAWMAVRAEGDEPGLVGLWRGDDRSGPTMTDYSPTAAHATISGVEGTDYRWVSSGLGTPDMAGRPMPALIGDVHNAPADLTDPELEEWRANDRAAAHAITDGFVRDEGEELDPALDFDWPDGEPIIALTSEAGEPLTVGVHHNLSGSFSQVDAVLGGVASTPEHGSVLVDRGPLTNDEVSVHRLHSLYPNRLGIHTRRRRVDEVAGEILAGMGGYLTAARDGSVVLDAVIPPTAPGPRGGKCVEVASARSQQSGVAWSTGATFENNNFYTLAGWFKLHRSWAADDPFGDIQLMRLYGPNDEELRWNIDADSGSSRMELEFYWSGTKQSQVSGGFLAEDPLGEWVFLAVTNDGILAQYFYGVLGGSLRVVSSSPGMDFSPFPVDFRSVQVGGDLSAVEVLYPFFRGGIAFPRVWNVALSTAQLEAHFGGTEHSTNRAFVADLDGTSTAALTDKVSGAVGVVTGDVAERPDLEVDLRKVALRYVERALTPAERVDVTYRRNYAPLTTEQFAATATADERAALREDSLSVYDDDPDADEDYRDARPVVLDSHWYTKIGALATLRLARFRLAPGRRLAELNHLPGASASAFERLALLLDLGAEVRVYGAQPDLLDGPVYRVVEADVNHGALYANLGLLR